MEIAAENLDNLTMKFQIKSTFFDFTNVHELSQEKF